MCSSNNKLKEIEELQAAGTEKALELMLDLIRDNDRTVQLTAIEALPAFSEINKAKDTLIKLSEAKDDEIRYYAVESLGYFSGADVGEVLIRRLSDSEMLIRVSAAEGLGNMQYKKAIPMLERTLADRSELVRGYAADALGKMGDKEIVPVLQSRLDEEKRSWVRLNYYLALYSLGDANNFHLILKMLRSKSYKTRIATANALAELANRENAHLVLKNLKHALSLERTFAARCSIKDAISSLQEIEEQN